MGFQASPLSKHVYNWINSYSSNRHSIQNERMNEYNEHHQLSEQVATPIKSTCTLIGHLSILVKSTTTMNEMQTQARWLVNAMSDESRHHTTKYNNHNDWDK
jgi:peptidyl-tRNA hydrolase